MKTTASAKPAWVVQEHDDDDHSILREFATKADALEAAAEAVADPRPRVTHVTVWRKTTVWRQAVTSPMKRQPPPSWQRTPAQAPRRARRRRA